MVERRFEVVVECHEDAPVSEHLREILSKLDSISGVTHVSVERTDSDDRDISEVYRILGDLSEDELRQLSNSIDSYTEDAE